MLAPRSRQAGRRAGKFAAHNAAPAFAALVLLLMSGALSSQTAEAQRLRLGATSDVPISVSVVTADDISLLPNQLRRAEDMLRLTPGVRGVPAAGTRIMLRGFRDDGTNVDGLYVTPEALDPQACERIEVLRGPGVCSLYGSAAMEQGVVIIAHLKDRSIEVQRQDAMDDDMADTDYADDGMARAWNPSWSFDLRAGLALPVGDLGDFQDPGLSLGAGTGYHFNPRLSGRLDLDLNFLKGISNGLVFETPGLNAYHLLGGLSYQVTPPTSGLFVDLYAGAGLARLSFDGSDSETKFNYAGAIKVGTAIGENSDIAVRAKLHRIDAGGGTWSLGQAQLVYQIHH